MISTKNDEEIRLMEYAGKVCYELLEAMEGFIKAGVTTKEINDYADKFIRDKDCIPSELGYEGYPASICTSINEEVVHGIPGNRSLKNGDIISLDVVACYKGYHADTARTKPYVTHKRSPLQRTKCNQRRGKTKRCMRNN